MWSLYKHWNLRSALRDQPEGFILFDYLVDYPFGLKGILKTKHVHVFQTT